MRKLFPNITLSTSAATLLLFALQLAITLSPSLLQARTMYLATDGDDSALCENGSAFRTLGRALGCLAAGDTLIIKNGTYQGGLIVKLEGTAEAPIFIQGESLEAVISGSVNKLDAIRLDHSSHVIIDRLTAREADRAGIGVIHCRHITITNGFFADNGKWGIFTGFADDIHFEGNECRGSKEEHGIYHSNSGDRFVIRGNVVHHNSGCGIHMNGDPEMGGDGVLNFGLVEKNIVYNNGMGAGGAGINMTHVQDIIVRNNLLYKNYAGGFTLYQDTGTIDQNSQRALIMGNTAYFSRYSGRNVVNIGETTKKVLVAGNILVVKKNSATLELNSNYLSSFKSDYNIHWGNESGTTVLKRNSWISLDSWQSTSGNDIHSYEADPEFVSLDSADFSPSAGSPAVDAGMPLDTVRSKLESMGEFEWILAQLDSLPNEDILGNRRPAGSAPDAGAYEQGGEPVGMYDFNGDGQLNIADAVAMLLLSMQDPTNPELDINGDGIYLITDVIALILYIMQNPEGQTGLLSGNVG